MTIKRLVATALLALSALLTFPSLASAHAPVEWSDPMPDSVVTEVPEKITMRFAEEPVTISMRTLELSPKTSIALAPRKVAERTYEVPLPKNVTARNDNTIVILISIHSKDGHDEVGAYLLHVQDTSTTTKPRPAPTTAPKVVGPLGTTPPAVFTPPADDNTVTLPIWLVVSVLGGVIALFAATLHKARSRK